MIKKMQEERKMQPISPSMEKYMEKKILDYDYKQSSVRKRNLLLAADSMPGNGKIDQMDAL